MRNHHRRFMLGAAAALGVILGTSWAPSAQAQMRGGTSGGFSGSSGRGGSSSGSGFVGSSGSFSGSSGSFSGGSFSGSSGSFSGGSFSGNGSFAGNTGSFVGSGGGMSGQGSYRGTSVSGGITGGGVSATNFLSQYYSNPTYLGGPNGEIGSTSNQSRSGSGFGQPSFGNVTVGGVGTASSGYGVLGSSSTIGGSRLGGYGASGTAGITSSASVGASSPPTNIIHTATMRNPVPAPAARAEFRPEVRAVIARSTALSTPGNIQVEVEGQTVILKGKVPNDEERRLAEGLIRLTPGVRMVRNELVVE